MLCLRTTRAPALCVAALAIVSATALAGSTLAGSSATRTSGSAYAVHISVPGARASGTLSSPAGSYRYRDLVSVQGYVAGSAISGPRVYAHSELTGVSLLGGFVTAEAITAKSFADGSTAPATGTFGGTVTGLVVAGASVSLQPGARFEIPGIGWGTLDERADVHSEGAYRGFEVGLRVHLSSDWHDLPAGTEIVLGYAQAAAVGTSTAARSGAATAPSAAVGERGGAATSDPAALGAPVITLPAGDRTPTDTGGDTPTGIAAPPPGGFTLTPTIDPARYRGLTAAGYVFPVAGGAHYGHDFGEQRPGSGFHEGSDLFAPPGTPVVAVRPGVLHNVGWDHLGGWRLWLEDAARNWFYYAHLSAYAPGTADGAHVSAGDVLGFIGNTGDAVGEPTHLHFEIHPAGTWAVPPYDYLQAWQMHRDPSAGSVTTLPPPPLGTSQLPSTDISGGSGLDDRAILTLARGKPVDSGFIALGGPIPTAAELRAEPSTP
jgi:murein DD-endopeptidase MepM/ murein hydrolase activator NlpD